MRRTILVAGACLLALAACSKSETAKVTEKTTTTAVNAATGQASGGTTEVAAAPTRKAGLWEQTINSERMKQTISMCVDEATEQKARWWSSERGHGPGQTDCTDQKFSRTLTGGWQIHSVCKVEGMTVTTDGAATGDFGSHYHVELTSVTTGSSMPEANGTHKMSMDGVWKGPCPAGMVGGDMVLPGGMKMNVLNPAAGPSMPGMKPGERPTAAQIQQMRAMAEKMKAQSEAH
jgi:hypothetical protein